MNDPIRNALITNVDSSATNVTLVSERRGRRGFSVYNDSVQTLYLKYGATATTDDYTVLIPGGTLYEDPHQYTGRLDGIWAAANGKARVTEVF